MAHHECLLGSDGRGSQETVSRDQQLQMKRQEVPDKDMVPVLLHFPDNKDEGVVFAHIRVLNIDKVDLSGRYREGEFLDGLRFLRVMHKDCLALQYYLLSAKEVLEALLDV